MKWASRKRLVHLLGTRGPRPLSECSRKVSASVGARYARRVEQFYEESDGKQNSGTMSANWR